MVREVESVIRRKLSRPNLALSSPQQYLLESMYSNEFQSFVKQRLIEQAEVKLGRHKVANADGLGDCFCLTNPRLPDHPIVLVSDGFNAVTGYPRSQIVGRNCRFLQGPGTSPESVQRIRDALNRSEACTELLLNYRRDGTPFYCLLCIIPLRDHNGNLVYYIGGQTNVTSVFAEETWS
ncbi:PAS domain-containing protein [Cantharellus anzutake]|uniref:PAS domain-containing protein n=1 Tax=Cantharellus anzutake TaxID=1750568 RepID=UPI001905C037|nr:PAS domain-containing protein [Cantharellus anzutake]KAF8320538.1 PAS domain-containing protein [Cantharellus anzutake]